MQLYINPQNLLLENYYSCRPSVNLHQKLEHIFAKNIMVGALHVFLHH